MNKYKFEEVDYESGKRVVLKKYKDLFEVHENHGFLIKLEVFIEKYGSYNLKDKIFIEKI